MNRDPCDPACDSPTTNHDPRTTIPAQDLTHPATLRALMAGIGRRPSRRLGQNFLCRREALDSIVAAIAPEGEALLEIGAGLGALTRELAARAQSLVAVEADEHFRPVLERLLAGFAGTRLIIGDFLELDRAELGETPRVAVGNLPYVAATPIIFRFLEGRLPWKRLVFMVQAEVAERMAAAPGGKAYGALSVTAQAASRVEIIRRFSSSCFWPRPRVESALVRLTPRGSPPPAALRELVRTAFAGRRKQLRNALGSVAGLADALQALRIEPARRPETLSVEEWLHLACLLRRMNVA